MSENHEQPTKGLAIGWLKEYQSAVVRYQQQFQQTNKYQLFVLIFGFSFSIG